MSTRQTRTVRTSTHDGTSATSSAIPSSSKRGSLAVDGASTGASTTAPRKLGSLWGSSTTAQARASPAPGVKSTPRPLWSTSRANDVDTGSAPNATPSLNSKRSAFSLGAHSKPPPAKSSTAQSTVSHVPVHRSSMAPLTSCRPSNAPTSRPSAVEEQTVEASAQPPHAPLAVADCEKRGLEGYDPIREPIKAYLRVRPAPTGVPQSANYVQVISDSEVLMTPPADHRLNSSTSSLFSGPLLRTSEEATTPGLAPQHASAPLGSIYKFTKVFAPSDTVAETSQADFFKATTLPLVHDFLHGENCLLFAYGTTGSGKTWTVQGEEGDKAGILPRVMDVVWRSLEGKSSTSNLRPSRLAGVEMTTEADRKHPVTWTPSKGPTGLGVKPVSSGLGSSTALPEIVNVDDNFEYSIWVSYAEVYLEKIYDLLESPVASQSVSTSSTASVTSNMFQAGLGLFSAGGAKAKAMVKGFQTVKRNALSLKHDKSGGNKYVHGMREVRVHSAEEARALLERGQVNRRVFSTLANRASSRSHSVFTIKIIKIRKGANVDDPDAATTSRFSIVDLAGSERVNNTQAFGERLKEAGQINKSLMVLGQCMEVLRKNQERGEGRKPALVPFRHSKLTELFQSFFIGNGKAVMIVNVNPYETSFDENSHVMKFSAVAKGVMTIKNDKPVAVPSTTVALTPQQKEPRIVRVSMYEGAEEEDVIYEEEEEEAEDDEEDEFVNALLDELSTLRKALFESQMNSMLVESQVRARVVQEYEAKMIEMERIYEERLREEAEEAETMLNAKLDILTRLNAASARVPTPVEHQQNEVGTPSTTYDDSDEDESMVSEDSRGAASTVEKMLLSGPGSGRRTPASPSPSPSPSPLAARSTTIDIRSPLSHSVVTATLDAERDEEGREEEEDEDEEDDEAEDDEDDEDEDDEDDEDEDDEEVEEDDASDEYEEASSESEDEDELIPVPRRSTGRASTARTSMARASLNASTPAKMRAPMVERSQPVLPDFEEEVVIVVTTKSVLKTPAKERVSSIALINYTEQDENDEIVLGSPMKSVKKKRNLGGSSSSRFKDVDDLDAIADSLAPKTPVAKTSIAASIRSLKR
ncbi:BQ5605_C042g12013 [Microbotryum silenes-dioicae]|uniref:BQ5605_C042g12013 protein n=1 Tax=Microbotryum silenes-dioicae TaxID=796604 RepID=A0A2X0MQK5_9BASI|nr:BQ5605_C042g12013 [Microbotryum silenes-dioicae]